MTFDLTDNNDDCRGYQPHGTITFAVICTITMHNLCYSLGFF